jgi:hypothetical protein
MGSPNDKESQMKRSVSKYSEPSPTTIAIAAADQAHLGEALRSELWERRGFLGRLKRDTASR